ncbi:O-antigen ligase family protein [Tenacibaculum agarivorans]|uniref:O-antigen ligase family protein n=1 Tax=Tenacibaculum agarivorans TaxID=1908389 RepID=UPI00094BB8D7|nr:O-antigen ligase family protein [Tenacibaculum agarivorans]
MNQSIKQTALFLKDPFRVILFLLVSICFQNTNTFCLILFGVITCLHFIKLFKGKISDNYFFSTYFHLFIYSIIFYGSINKTILVILLLFFLQFFLKTRNSFVIPEKFNEWLFIILFLLITINHFIFPPYLIGLDIFIYLLLVPLFFLGLKKLSFKISLFTSLKVFIISVLFTSILLIIINLFQGKIIDNTYFSKPIGLSHVYMGIFLGFSNIFILILYSKEKYFLNLFIDLTLFIFNISLIAYIGARLALLSLFFILFLFIYQKIKLKPFFKIIIALVLLTSLVFFGSKNTRFKKGTQEINELYESIKIGNKKSIIENSAKNMYLRYLVYSYTIKELKTSWVLGIGMQNVEKKISKKIVADGYKNFWGINTHNQYLHFFIGMGVFGFFYFLYLIFFLFKSKNMNLYFILFFSLIMITESALVRGKGILLFTFFSLLFLNKSLLDGKNCSHS